MSNVGFIEEREASNVALERLAQATTDKGYSPASPLQALVRCVARPRWQFAGEKVCLVFGFLPASEFLKRKVKWNIDLTALGKVATRDNEVQRLARREFTMRDDVSVIPLDSATVSDINNVVGDLCARDSRVVMFPEID